MLNDKYLPNFDEQEVNGILLVSNMLMLIKSLETYIQFIFIDKEIISTLLSLVKKFDKEMSKYSDIHIYR